MAGTEDLQKLIVSLDIQKATQEKVQTLEAISNVWYDLNGAGLGVTDVLKGNKILLVFANVMEEQYQLWAESWPAWTDVLLYCVKLEREFEHEIYPLDQVRETIRVFRKYIMEGKQGCLRSFRHLATLDAVKQLLFNDGELYNALKQDLGEYQLQFLRALCTSYEWKLKLISDSQFIANLLATPESDTLWSFFVSLALHPDAKTLLPIKEVIAKASKSTHVRCAEVCALLCNDDDLKTIKLSTDWLTLTSDTLQQLIKVGKASVHNVLTNLLVPILPIANLSAVDTQKESLGKLFIPLLMQIVTEELPNTIYITEHLRRARQEAARALWNFAYLESNRTLIAKEGGIDKLNAKLAKTDDETLKGNISGILHMFSAPTKIEAHKSEEKARGHVMISYNWGNQTIVKRIAKTLKENGYNVWLDIEQMGGSTLEAMARAVEQSETMLICMSQKYKDSPNCRLEGEYCVNSKVRYIPLMMQKGYRPDGWLGIALGSKLYYEFTDEANWDSKMGELVKAIGEYGKVGSNILNVPTITAKPAEPATKVEVEWTNEDMREWMKQENIVQHYELFKRHAFTKRSLLELQHYLNHPQFLFMWERMGIAEYGKILLISSAIRNLK